MLLPHLLQALNVSNNAAAGAKLGIGMQKVQLFKMLIGQLQQLEVAQLFPLAKD